MTGRDASSSSDHSPASAQGIDSPRAREALLTEMRAAPELRIALAALVRAFAAETATLHFLEADGLLHLAGVHGMLPPFIIEQIQRIPVGKGMAGVCAELNQPVTWCNLNQDKSGVVQTNARSSGLSGSLVVPVRDGSLLAGTVGIANSAERTFTELETELLLECAQQLLMWRNAKQ